MTQDEKASLLIKKQELETKIAEIRNKLKIASSVFQNLANELSKCPENITFTHVQSPYNGFPLSLMAKTPYDWDKINEIIELVFVLRKTINELTNVEVSLTY